MPAKTATPLSAWVTRRLEDLQIPPTAATTRDLSNYRDEILAAKVSGSEGPLPTEELARRCVEEVMELLSIPGDIVGSLAEVPVGDLVTIYCYLMKAKFTEATERAAAKAQVIRNIRRKIVDTTSPQRECEPACEETASAVDVNEVWEENPEESVVNPDVNKKRVFLDPEKWGSVDPADVAELYRAFRDHFEVLHTHRDPVKKEAATSMMFSIRLDMRAAARSPIFCEDSDWVEARIATITTLTSWKRRLEGYTMDGIQAFQVAVMGRDDPPWIQRADRAATVQLKTRQLHAYTPMAEGRRRGRGRGRGDSRGEGRGGSTSPKN